MTRAFELLLALLEANGVAGREAAYFHQMIHRNFDLTGIYRFVLSPYWRIATNRRVIEIIYHSECQM